MLLTSEENNQLKELCQAFSVQRLSVFGSLARGDERPDSDLDVYAEFSESLSAVEYATNYFALKEAIESMFNRPVDLLTQTALKNPFLKKSIEAEQRVLLCSLTIRPVNICTIFGRQPTKLESLSATC